MKETDVIKVIQKWLEDDVKGIRCKDLRKLGLDTSGVKIEIGNFLLTKDPLLKCFNIDSTVKLHGSGNNKR